MNVAIVFIFVLAICFIPLIYRWRKNKSKYDDLTDSEPLQSEVVRIDFNGKYLYLAPEDMPAWNGLSNAQKRHVHMRQLELLRKGVIVKVTDENGKSGIITRNEAIAKGVIKN